MSLSERGPSGLEADVVCVGAAFLDVLAPGLEGIPDEGGHATFIDSLSVAVGGDAANQAIVLGRLGRRVRLLTALGSDEAGDVVMAALLRAGIDVSGVCRTTSRPTSVSLVSIRPSGERSFVVGRHGAASSFGPRDLPTDPLPERFRVLSIGSLNCSRTLDSDVLPGLCAEARRRGAVVVADMVTDHLDVDLEALRPVLEHVDLLMPSEIELAHFTGTSDPIAGAEVIRTFGVREVVVKRGERGSVLVGRGGVVQQPALPANIVDTTGAGDSFVAGFVSGLVDDLDAAGCLARAAAAAAVTVSSVGANRGFPLGVDLDACARTTRGDKSIERARPAHRRGRLGAGREWLW